MGKTTSLLSTVEPKIRPQLPLVDVSDVEQWILTDHAIERAEERGIGILEIYSVLAAPTGQGPGKNGETAYYRGDLKVVGNPTRKVVLTVVDLDEDSRTVPRQPLNPLVSKGAAVPARQRNGSAVLDEVWCFIPHDDDDYRKMDVTPALAEKMLGHNTHNRPIRRRDVETWKAKILAGEMARTHQGIAFDSNVVLLDGQNRLTAIVETGLTVSMWVGVGFPPSNFTKIDGGRNRNYADILALAGETDVTVLGATVRLVHLFTTRDYSAWAGQKISNETVFATFSEDADNYREAVKIGRAITDGARLTKTAAAAGFYVIRRVNRADAVDEFFDGLISGAGLTKTDPRLKLRNVLANAEGRAHGPMHLALLLKTWNAWTEGIEVRALAWRKGEAMPRVTRKGR